MPIYTTNGDFVADTLPLGAAAERLRGKPGRPRKLGTPQAQSGDDPRVNGGSPSSTHDSESGRPERQPAPLTERRLLDVAGAADYLSLSRDTIRTLDLSGARVKVPGARGQSLRNVLFDRLELDRLVAGWRMPA